MPAYRRKFKMNADEFFAWVTSQCTQNENGCLIWKHGVDDKGQPNAGFQGKTLRLHQAICERILGRKLSYGEHAIRRCGNRLCLNESHIYAGAHDDLNLGQRKPRMSEDELIEWIQTKCSVDENSGCVIWNGHVDTGGYPQLTWKGKVLRIAKFIFEREMNTKLKDEECLCHKCDTRRCINQNHFFIGTRTDNNADRNAKGRQAKGEKTGCSKLKNKDVLEIVDLFNSRRFMLKEIGEYYGVSPSRIGEIMSGKSWTHVTGFKRRNPWEELLA